MKLFYFIFREINNITFQSEPLDSDIISTSDSREADDESKIKHASKPTWTYQLEPASTYATDDKSRPISILESSEVRYLSQVNPNDKLDEQYNASGA